ncbi:MAG: HRDC domain-containing protein, partial [Phycisphaerales bacterium]|nr:HRDC domain-containing protein [Phycisphaerales bacterium]
QDAFARETLDIVVATVAFGMGIDRSNVRCVIHAAMPKSVEHYQQEAGRAGRDGLPAECVLLYSPADAIRWESMLSRPQDEAPPGEAPSSGASNGSAAAFAAAAAELLGHMRAFCCAPGCRHRRLVEYFGQAFDRENCGACDACLGEIELGGDERVVAQKILSCVARVKERFGVGHVVDVLTGASTARIAQFEHDKLSTYGLLRDLGKPRVTSLVNQLLDQGLLARRTMEVKGMSVPVLALNDASWEVLRNERPVHFRKDAEPVQETASEAASWEGVDRELFDALRELRRRLAEERGVAPFVLFHDSTLRSLARVRPSTLAALGAVRGIGERKREDLGGPVLEVINRHVRERGLAVDQPDRAAAPPAGPRKASTSDLAAAALFAKGASVADVCTQMGRAQSTVYGYLEQYILRSKPARIDAWIDDASYAAIAAALEKDASGLLRPVFEALGGTYSYEQIRIVGAHRRALAGP